MENARGRLLVFGAGRGGDRADWRGADRLVVGVDVDPDISENPGLDAGVVYGGETLPFSDDSFDLCLARWVLEHLEHPERTFGEIHRVLKPGGRFLFVTSNLLYFPYMLSRLIPDRFHPPLVRWTVGRGHRDVFPTYYRANTRSALRRLLGGVGFRQVSLDVHLPRPAYLEFSLPTLAVGMLYEKVVNAVPVLEDFRQAVVGEFEKPE